MDYRVYMKFGEIELGVTGVEPDKALELFNRMRGSSDDGQSAGALVPTKEMIAAGAEVFRKCRTDPVFARAMSDEDMVREVFAAMVRAS